MIYFLFDYLWKGNYNKKINLRLNKIFLDKESKAVHKYEAGDYFGELSLLKDVPISANIIANVLKIYLREY